MAKDTDIVIDNFQKAIADSPHLGFEDIRSLNVLSSPGAVSLNFKLESMSLPPTVSALAYTVDTSTDIFTVSSTSGWYNGMALTLNTIVTSGGLTTGRVYWIGNLTATTFKLYKSPNLIAINLVNVSGSNGSGTLSSYAMTAPLDKAIYYDGPGTFIRTYVFILDDEGKVWWVKNDAGTLTNSLVYLGNDTLTSSGNRAIAVWKGYLLVFRSGQVDYLKITKIEQDLILDFDSASGWVYAWDGRSSVSGLAKRAVLVGQDDALYFQNGGNRLGSYVEVAGQTFDPTNGATFTENTTALDLPEGDDVISLGELGISLLIGTRRNLVYPWDRVSPSFDIPIHLPEYYIAKIITINNVAYLFAGKTGCIYQTDGSSVALFKKIPDHVSGVFEPYYTWNDAIPWRNQLYFSFAATENDGTVLNTTAGVWAIDTTTGALRYTNQPSHGTYSGSVTVIVPHVLSDTPPGNALYVGWTNTTNGFDVSFTSYHTGYSAYFISPMFRPGVPISKRALTQAEFTFDQALASDEGVKLSFRRHRNTAWSTPVTFDFATYGAVQHGMIDFPISDCTTAQFKLEMTGDTTTPSLREVRIT